MNITEKNVREFIDAINRDAFEECKKIECESEEFLKNEYKLAEMQIRREMEEKKISRITRIKSETNREITRLSNEAKKINAKKREEIENKVFSDAREKLAEFAKSEKYLPFLVMSARKLITCLGDGEITFFMRPEDMAFSEEIKNEIGDFCKFECDSTIVTGGLRAKKGTTLADDTLDMRLFEQREWFRMNSGLSL